MDTTSSTVIVSSKDQKILFYAIKKIKDEGRIMHHC